MKRLIFYFITFLVSYSLSAQIGENLKRMAESKAKKLTSKENLEKVGNAVLKDMDKARAEFDSTDFDYAILLSDNSGLFDVKEKGELNAKFGTWSNLGTSFYKNTEFTDAENARFNLEMGELAYASGKFTYADNKYKTAKALYEKSGLTDDLGYIKVIAGQGLLYATMGRFTQAEAFTLEALDLRKEKLGASNIGVASSLNNYGVLRYNLARYNEAEQDLAQALSILDQNNAGEIMPYAIVLNNQAMLFQTVGRYAEAEDVLKKAISIAEKLQSKKSRNHLKFLSNLALLYQQMGQYSQAESIYLGMEKRLGKNDPDYASMLNNLAALYMITGKEDKAEEPLKKSMAIYKSNFGEENPAYAKSTSDLGNFYRYKSRYTEAQPLLEKALSIREKTLGVNHPLYVQSQEDIAILFWKQKSWDVAYMRFREVMDKSVDFVNRYFPPMSEAEKTKYWDVLAPRFQRFENFAIECHLENQHVLEDLLDYQLATKALLLNSTNRIKQAIFASGNAELIRDYVSWLDQKERLARLYAYSKEELKTQKINLDSMERAANMMERKLSERSAEFSAGYSAQKISYKQVQGLLNETDALVEIIRVRNFGQAFTDDVKYAALVLTRKSEIPKLVIFPNGQQLETRYAKFYKNAIQQKIDDEYSYDQYWAALEPELTGKKLIYISPDGVYNQINLNTLRRSGGDYFINRFDLVILGNSKDLIDIKKRKASTSKKIALLAGFPDYGGTAVSPLPGTKTEIEGIGKILKASGYQVTSFLATTATEANIKNAKAPSVMHIATHGYFLQDATHHSGTAFGVNLENANDNALLRSGLLFAGGAKTAAGAMPNLVSNDNGVLTAYEAMNLNLQGTDLVVLSACETGLGDVKAGEGVYGLQRAFLVAGAEAIIMSLWKVDDAATQTLMTNFYTNWLKLRDKQKAFKQAQLQLMTKYKEPYYWGAFVMMGI
ncbi:MAG TPA: CHAT domain-containing tetratricopeptide repeat protein [Cyclobacteriaceae bacterium]|nr:CHAT domain-containing tetratricopeptide repeat protein [Cyclobacteriaceae bacterium]